MVPVVASIVLVVLLVACLQSRRNELSLVRVAYVIGASRSWSHLLVVELVQMLMEPVSDIVRSCRVGLCGTSAFRSEVSTSCSVISTSRISIGVASVRNESVVACVVLVRRVICGRAGCCGNGIMGAPGGAGGAGGTVGAVGICNSSSEIIVSSGPRV